MENEFNYDLDRMKEAVQSPTVEMPDCVTTAEGIRAWLLDEAEVLECKRLVKLCEETGYTMPSGLTREERHKWARETMLAHDYWQKAQEVLTTRGNKRGIRIDLNGLTEAEACAKMAEIQLGARWYQVLVEGVPVTAFPEGVNWDPIAARTQLEFMTMDFTIKMDVYRKFIEHKCANMTMEQQDAACHKLLQRMRLIE